MLPSDQVDKLKGQRSCSSMRSCAITMALPVVVLALLSSSTAALQIERRAYVQGLAGGAAALALTPAAQAAAAATALKTVKWSATDGFDSDFPSQINFIEFDEKAYRAMRDDPRRTPKFAKAIRARPERRETASRLCDGLQDDDASSPTAQK